VTIDCHKWLNVAYDCAIALVRKEYREYQYRAYAQEISVKNPVSDDTDYTSLGNEGSRRLRALAVWMTLMAYGKKGYAEMVDRDCAMARLFADKLEASGLLRLMGPVRLNGFAFTLNKDHVSDDEILLLRQKIRLDGGAFLNHTKVLGVPAMRCSLSNWGIQEEDVEAVAASVIRCAAEMLAPPENVQ
jgi:glutamate/tyrosine decarboxylase-like PLP-dependent enzyme